MKITEINTVCFIGAGTMGCANAITAGLAGYKVIIFDISTISLDSLPLRLKETGNFLAMQGLVPQSEVENVISKIKTTNDLVVATAHADLISESVFENLDVKREVHKQLDRLCLPHTIITTNTSSFLVSEIDDVVSNDRGRLFAALHSHLGSVLVDIVGGPRTLLSTIDILERYVLSINALPLVLKKETRGYVLNAMLGPVLTTSMLLYQSGNATVAEIDRAWMNQQVVKIGPFGLIDLFGLNVVYESWQNPRPLSDYEINKAKIMTLLKPYIKLDELGAKKGKGFYSYPNPDYAQPDFLSVEDHLKEYNYSLLRSALINAAVILAVNDVASPDIIDNAWKVAMTSPSGPFELLNGLGGEIYLELLNEQIRQGWFNDETTLMVKTYINNS
ncbi:3-hydroxyacyl-CoA dehydrogenase NAD-binding domain-containing protein [Gammaproteobacteria bacterium]|nr:3-hydroxyacyl-CoA dehydrogenase NAD-binding domain-containing protein [Gammaproteobacteria bacterium]